MHFRCVEKLKFSYQKQSGGWLIILPYWVLTPTTKKSALGRLCKLDRLCRSIGVRIMTQACDAAEVRNLCNSSDSALPLSPFVIFFF